MPARKPEELDRLFAAALNRGDVDALVSLYETDGCLVLEPGKVADLAVIDAASPEEWIYCFRANACRLTVAGGRAVWRSPEE